MFRHWLSAIDQQTVQRHVGSYLEQVGACYESQLQGDPALTFAGKLTFVVGADGKVSDAKLDGQVPEHARHRLGLPGLGHARQGQLPAQLQACQGVLVQPGRRGLRPRRQRPWFSSGPGLHHRQVLADFVT